MVLPPVLLVGEGWIRPLAAKTGTQNCSTLGTKGKMLRLWTGSHHHLHDWLSHGGVDYTDTDSRDIQMDMAL